MTDLVLNDKAHPTPRTVALGKRLQRQLEGAHKRLRTTGNPAQEVRDIATAETALKVYDTTLRALIADAKNAVKQGWTA